MRAARKAQQGPGGLIEFIRYHWDVLEPKKKFVDGWALRALCQHLEAVTFGQINRLLANVPPGFMKSMAVDVFWPAWEWSACDKPDMRYVAFSYAAHLTERDNGKFRDLIKSRKFQELWGNRFALTKDGETKVGNDKTGWKLATSIRGVGTGERGDRAIVDDPHNVKESESETVREETARWFREALQNRLNDLEQSAIVVIMQRVHQLDVSGVILKEFGDDYVHLCIPMEYDPLYHCETAIGWSDPRTERGELAWAERFPAHTMAPFKRSKYLWAGQYQQTPSPRGGGILHADWWRLWDEDEAIRQGCKPGTYPPFEYVVASLDTAYTEKQENDPSALTIWGVWTRYVGEERKRAQPCVMLISAWEERLELNALVSKTVSSCRRYRVDRMLIEAKAAGHSVAQEIKRLYADEPWVTQLIDPGRGDKVARAYSVQSILESGLVYAPDREWAQNVINQCADFPRGSHDDLTDTVTQALQHLRVTGLLRTEDEIAIEDEEARRHRPQAKPLYAV